MVNAGNTAENRDIAEEQSSVDIVNIPVASAGAPQTQSATKPNLKKSSGSTGNKPTTDQPTITRKRTIHNKVLVNRTRKANNQGLPDFVHQVHQMGCKCEICSHQNGILKRDGYDPAILDLIEQKNRQDKFLNKQVECDQKMRDLYKEITEHSNYIKKQETEDNYTIKQGIMLEMDRIAQNKATKFNKGDYFTYEEQDYNWLIQKLAGTPESTYMGCPLKVPETVIFTNGKPTKVIKTTPDDNCVNVIKSNLTIPELRKHLMTISQDRNTEHKRKLR